MTGPEARIEERFNGIDRRLNEVERRFDEVDRRVDRVEGQIVELRDGVRGLQTTLSRGSIGVVISLVGVIAAILAKGG